MSTQPVCGKCGGTGWIIIDRSSVSGAEPCECRSQGRSDRLMERAQIPVIYFDASFENFKADDNQDLRKVMNEVRKYADEYPQYAYPGILLIGEPGTGKTH